MTDISARKFAYLRIAFGLVWAVDASLKWRPEFQRSFAGFLSTGSDMPSLLNSWIHLFGSLININPPFFALFIALSESALALALIFGIFTRAAIIGGAILSFTIWSTVESFGMFWHPGATDLGASAGYLLVFIALWLGRSWQELSVDKRLNAYLKKKFL